jgi:hypothetical protein
MCYVMGKTRLTSLCPKSALVYSGSVWKWIKIPKRRNTVPPPFGVFTQEQKHGPYRTAVKTFGLLQYIALTSRQKTLSSPSNTWVFRNVGVTHPTTRSHTPEDLNLQQHHCKNFTYHMMMMTVIIIIIIIIINMGGNEGKIRQRTLVWPCTKIGRNKSWR